MNKFSSIPENITFEDVDEGANLSNVEQEISMAYDESGNRIWYSVEDADGSGYALATLPGVGVYYADRTSGSLGKFSLKRMDLVAGGFREGVNGAVYIPVADAQGNVWIIAEFDKRGSPYSYMHSISLQGALW